MVLILGALALLFGTSFGRTLLPSAVVSPAATAPAASAPAASAATAAPQATPAPAEPAPNLSAAAITLQRASTLTVTHELTNTTAGPVAYAPDGRLLALGIDRQIVLYSDGVLSRLPATVGSHPGHVATLAFAPDGQLLASGAVDDPVVRLWDPAGVKPPRTLTGHTDWIRSVAFSPDGSILASGSVDKTIKLWGRGQRQ